jgi:organic hydroperoxide reductase OsmC/OhrA
MTQAEGATGRDGQGGQGEETTGRPSPVTPAGEVHVALEQMEAYEFRVRFDDAGWPELVTDEPVPLGRDRGPNPSRLFAASIGTCLAASLLFCLRKSGIEPLGLEADVRLQLVRNERKRLRVGKIRCLLRPHLTEDEAKIAACLAAFEDFCVVTASVREGIDVEVDVQPLADGTYGCEG